MLSARLFAVAMLCVSASFIISCGKPDSRTQIVQSAKKNDGENVLNLYIWADYIAPDTIASFEKITGIKVRISIFETNETLEARMLTGDSGFDVVVPTAPFFERQIHSGAYAPLDKAKLPNLVNLDPAIMSRVALNDPGNTHGIVYAWGTYGIGYNTKSLAKALPGVPIDSWRVLFDPAFASKAASCGINILDAPAGIVRLVLKYLGRDPNAARPQDLADVEKTLLQIRPYIRNIDSSIGTEALANGDICMALDYSGTVFQARQRAIEAHNGRDLNFVLPREGSLLWFDMLAIPRDAPNIANAHLFINYLMDPRVAANNTKAIGNANANSAATPLLDPLIASDTIVYPTHDQQERLFVQMQDSPEQSRAITRLWQKFKTAQ
jgi:putrescine transport system substrate-binding protein